jgi:hypothetical protein
MPLSLQDKLQAAKEKALGKVGYKKGEPFKWRSTNRLDVKDKHPGWSYRWISEDSGSLEKRDSEGYQLVNDMSGIPGDIDPESDGMDGVKQHRELVLAAMPNELKRARDEHVQELTQRQTVGLKEELEEGLSQIDGDHGGHAEGKIVIE